jgi:ribonucleotide reductase alpha subunit
MYIMSFQDHVIKRNGEKEIFSFDKILKRVTVLGQDSNFKNELNINYTSLVQKIIDRLYDGIPTEKIDELTAQQCASLITTHPDYNKLASRILVSNHHKNTDENYLNIVTKLYNFKDVHGKNSPLVSKELFDLVVKNKDEIQSFFDFDRDYLVDYFGFKTLERAYLQRIGTNIVERPQHMWMRVSLAIHKNDLVKVKQTYDLMSQKFFTHATPTLFNAGTPRQQMSSCYLLAMKDDSIGGIYETLSDCASISKWAGGIGLHIHNVRASGSHIRGTNGTSNGIVPMLRVFNNTARYVDQCVLPETIIYTTNGPMEIQHCTTENNVFTTAGYEKIQNVLEHSYSGEILHIKSIHSFKDLSITPEHPVYCLKNQKGVNYSTIKNRIAKEIIKPEWIDAKDLTLEDMLIFTKPKYEKDVISISEDDCYMYGLLLGDGSMNNTSTSCYISLHSTDNLTFVKNYLTANCIQYFINTENNTSRVRWNKSMNLPFRYGTLYDENKGKVIHTSWLNLPIKKIKYIVKGLIDSDGCVAGEVVFDSTSLKLVEGLRYLLLRMGIPTGGYIRDRIGEKHISKYGDEIENKKISYCLRIPKTESIANLLLIEKGTFHKFFEHENLIYTRISNIEKGNYEGTLYDLQLEKTHNYMIHNGIVHNGGGKRNGSFAIYLEPWHGDIREFLDMKKTHGDEEQRARDLFYALWIPDLFMKRVSEGAKWTLMCPDKCPGLSDVYGAEFEALYTKYEKEGRGEVVQARDIWFKILDSQIETGTPYMLYKDACNKKSNQKNLGVIKSSNLCCVKGDTMLLTDKGHLPIQTLEDKKVNVWNGEEFSEVVVKQTNDAAELLTIEFSDGCELTCTKYHKFYIQSNPSIEIIEAQNLKPNMKIINCEFPVIDNKKELISAYDNGFGNTSSTKYFVPMDYSLKSKLDWLAGFFDANGSLNLDKFTFLILQIKSTCKNFLLNIKLMLQTCGISSKVGLIVKKQCYLSKHDTEHWRLLINSNELQKLDALGFFPKLLNIDKRILQKNMKQFVTITKIIDNGEIDKTFCFTEKKRHAGIFNGVITSQCEIIEFSDPEETAVCNLASIGLPKFVKSVHVEYDNLIIYSKPNCEYCKMAKNLISKTITTNIVEIVVNDENREAFKSKFSAEFNVDVKTLPQIIIDGKYIGGYMELLEMHRATFDYEKLHEVVKIVTDNLNKVIDINFYPTPKTKVSNSKHRPIGLGVQGLADVFMLMDLPFECEESKKINRQIFETMYHAAVESSMELSLKDGPYSTFKGSPASQGLLSMDLWETPILSGMYDWQDLKEKVKKNGLRNSLLVAPMPTASTSQILGNNECFEPYTSNIYLRRTVAGEFVMVNKHLLQELVELGLWNDDVKNKIISDNGSVQNIPGLPKCIKEKYKIVWEMPMKNIITMCAERAPFIDQSMSMNLWMENPTYNTLTAMHFFSFKQGLKTGLYYLRTKAKAAPQQFTIDPDAKPSEEDDCLMCGA